MPGYARLAASAEFIEQVIRPQAFFDCLDRLSIPYPEVSYQQPPANESWLYKQAFSCGGVGVSIEYAETPGYWQKRISGTPVSTLCIADPHQIRVIGFNQQLTESLFPDVPYAYAGAIANHGISEKNRLKIEGYLNKLRKEIDLLGVFSMDMIVTDEQCYILEINPRISASFELYEQLNPGLNLVDAHNGVCEGERLPEFRLSAESCAYRIVYAKKALLIPAGIDWPEWVKDRPETGRIIQCYEPICSLYASAAESQVQARLKQYEQELYVIINNKL